MPIQSAPGITGRPASGNGCSANAFASVARFAGLGDGVEYVSFGLELAAHLGAGVNLSFGVDGAFHAQNVPAAAQWKVGLSWER